MRGGGGEEISMLWWARYLDPDETLPRPPPGKDIPGGWPWGHREEWTLPLSTSVVSKTNRSLI